MQSKDSVYRRPALMSPFSGFPHFLRADPGFRSAAFASPRAVLCLPFGDRISDPVLAQNIFRIQYLPISGRELVTGTFTSAARQGDGQSFTLVGVHRRSAQRPWVRREPPFPVVHVRKTPNRRLERGAARLGLLILSPQGEVQGQPGVTRRLRREPWVSP